MIPDYTFILGDETMGKKSYLTTESITAAMKGYRALSRNGIEAHVERVSSSFSRKGCGHSIVIRSDLDKALEILRRNNIKIVSVYER